MTVYVIDAAHPLPPVYGERENALNLTDGDKVLLAAGSEIAAYGRYAYGISSYGIQAPNNTLMLDGRVHGGSVGVLANGTIDVGSEGVVSGQSAAIIFQTYRTPTNDVLNNSGRIESPGSALGFGGHMTVNNSGEIHGWIGFNGIYGAPIRLVLNNTGLIQVPIGIAVSGASHGSTTIRNTGHIVGDVGFGFGDDIYDGRGGTLVGRVFLSGGNDIAYGGDGSEEFALGQSSVYEGSAIIDGGGGIDTVQFGEASVADLRISDRQSLDQDSWAILRGIENLAGSDFQDSLTGNSGANVLMGLAGNDRLDGQGAADLLIGSVGDDTLLGGEGLDMAVFSGPSYKYNIAIGPDGTVTVSDNRASSDGADQLIGVEFAIFSDRIVALPTSPASTVSNNGGETAQPRSDVKGGGSSDPVPVRVEPVPVALTLKGGKRADALFGGDGNDYLNGGLGKDKLTGGDGQDVFAFTTKLGAANLDRVLDFRPDDTLALSSKVFKGLARGALAKDSFLIGSKALDAEDRILFNRKTGVLSFDADGSGTEHEAVVFAKLTTKVLGSQDFLIF
jgi:Ca2+-binding RTX toxin-like protein